MREREASKSSKNEGLELEFWLEEIANVGVIDPSGFDLRLELRLAARAPVRSNGGFKTWTKKYKDGGEMERWREIRLRGGRKRGWWFKERRGRRKSPDTRLHRNRNTGNARQVTMGSVLCGMRWTWGCHGPAKGV